jgi:DNA-binding beta-propeller fold protein YncE
MARLAVATMLLALTAATASTAAAPLRPLQCVGRPAGCTAARGIAAPTRIALAPDGRTAYVASGVGSLGSLGVFARDRRTQRLRQLQCVARRARACTEGRGLETPAAIAVSPDGRSVYVAAANGRSVGVYRRNSSGLLAAAGSVTRLAHPRALAVSPDGTSVYVGGDRLWIFVRARSGALRPAGVEDVAVSALAVTSDGSFLYSVGGGGRHGTLVTWRRDPRTGALTPAQALCSLADTGCAKGNGLLQPSGLALAPDGSTLWVTAVGSQSVTGYARDAATGGLAGGAQRRDLPAAADVTAAGGRVYVAYRDGLAILPPDLATKRTLRLGRAAAVAVAAGGVYVASSDRVDVLAR